MCSIYCCLCSFFFSIQFSSNSSDFLCKILICLQLQTFSFKENNVKFLSFLQWESNQSITGFKLHNLIPINRKCIFSPLKCIVSKCIATNIHVQQPIPCCYALNKSANMNILMNLFTVEFSS